MRRREKKKDEKEKEKMMTEISFMVCDFILHYCVILVLKQIKIISSFRYCKYSTIPLKKS